LADPAFVEYWLGSGTRPIPQVRVSGEAAGAFTVAVRSQVALAELPANLRNLLPGDLDIRQVIAWEKPDSQGNRQGTVAVDIFGAPVKLEGIVGLTKREAGQCEQRYVVELQATVPLFGGRIEQAAAGLVRHLLDDERNAMLNALASTNP
jgi:hypothetical protein